MGTRNISVKGVGKIKAKPDLIIISLKIHVDDINYEKTMSVANKQLEELRTCVSKASFQEEDLKTGRFVINTNYDSVRDKHGNYSSVFKGYKCTHELSLAFDFDMNKLSNVLNLISKTSCKPVFSISFTIKDVEEVKSKLLTSAVLSARTIAEILASAANIKLGKIVSIHYNWEELHIFSNTRYEPVLSVNDMLCEDSMDIDIEPEDINLEDNVSIVWEIEDCNRCF